MLLHQPTLRACRLALVGRFAQRGVLLPARPHPCASGPIHGASRFLSAWALMACLWLSAPWALAQTQGPSVYLVGTVGERAILVVDQNPPRTLGVGDSRNGVKLLSVGSGRAEVEVNGARLQLTLGQMPMKIGVDQPTLVLQSDSRGHFTSQGLINNREVNFLIDTGASVVSMGANTAQALGIGYEKNGKAVKVSTANGETEGWLVTLDSVHVGQLVQHNVRAVVTPQAMPYVLLGNSFLDAFHLARQSNRMTIKRQP